MDAALPQEMLLQGVGSKGPPMGAVLSVGGIERRESLAENLCGDYAWRTIVKVEIFEEKGISGDLLFNEGAQTWERARNDSTGLKDARVL
jgi:hypothetical protein